MIEIYPTSKFKKSYKKLPQFIKSKAEKREKLFISNPFHPVFKTHKLKGKLKNYWSYSVDDSYRILLKFINNNKEVISKPSFVTKFQNFVRKL